MARHSRRSVLRKGSIAVVGSAALAGCTGGGDGGTNTTTEGGGDTTTTTDSGPDPTEGESYELTAGSLFARETADTQMFIRLMEDLEEKTDGRITGQVLAQQVGGGEDHINATASGTIDFHAQAIATLTNAYGPEYGFVGTPFIAQNWEHFITLHDEFIMSMDEFNGQLIEDGNQRILGAGRYGARSVTSNKPIRTPEDISGVKMRVPQITTWTTVWNAIGAEATPVAYDELYQALQTGVVGASEGPMKQVFDASLYEVQSHFSLTNHVLTDSSVSFNEDRWQSFSEADKELFQTTLDENLQWLNETVVSNKEELRTRAVEDHGMTIVEDVDREAFVEAGTSALETMSEDWVIGYQEAIDMGS